MTVHNEGPHGVCLPCPLEATRPKPNRIEFSLQHSSSASVARCDCFTDDKFITVFFAPFIDFPLRSELIYVDHPLFKFHLRREP